MNGEHLGHAVFDLDGTLVHSVGVTTDILNAMLVERGSSLVLTPEQTRRQVAYGGVTMIAALLGEDCSDPHADIAEFRRRYRELPTPPSSLFPGVREGLSALRDCGVALSVCSNKPQHLCEKVLAELDLLPLFASVVGSEQSTPLKPHPALFHKALHLANGERARSCFVGDSEVDFQLARAVGAPFVLVTYGYAEPDANFRGARRADHFAKVPAIVERTLRNCSRPPRRSDAVRA